MSGFRRPPWWALLLTVAGALLFIRLGFWQLGRAHFKEGLVRRYAASVSAPLQDFAKIAATPPAHAFPRVRISGHYLVDRVYLLDNPNHDGQRGVEVFAPFRVNGTSAPLLLVDMGYLPGDGSDKTPVLPPLPAGKVTVKGSYVPPPPVGFEMGGNALARQTQWPKDSIFLDLSEVSGDLGQALYPRVLALDPDPASGYVRVHKLNFSTMTPARHRAYAFQWFAFALAAVAILLVLNRDKRSKKSR